MYGINSILYNIVLNKYYSYRSISKLSRTGFQKRTTVSVDEQVYQQLCKRGRFGESFSQLLKRLLNELDDLNKGVIQS
jgi:hypothetical protein